MNGQLRKNLIFNTAGSLLFYICQASMNLLVTALSGAAANGLLATAMTIANVGLSFASYGMRTFQVSDLRGKYADRTYLASRFVTVATAWLACMAFAFFNAYSAQQRWVIFVYTGYRLVESISDVWHGFLQKAERMDIVGISFGIRGLVTALSVSGGLWLTHNLVFTLGLLFLLNLGYVLAVDLPLALRRADLGRRGGAGLFSLLWECLPLAVYASLNTSISSVPRYFCERILGEVQLNYFANVFLPVMLLQVAAVSAMTPLRRAISGAGGPLPTASWPLGPPARPGWPSWAGGGWGFCTPPPPRSWNGPACCSRWWSAPCSRCWSRCCATCSPSPGR